MTILLFCLFVSFTYAYESQEPRDIKYVDIQKFKLADWIKQHFKATLINQYEDSEKELRRFQEFVLKTRNAECLFKKYGSFDQYAYELNIKNNENNKLKWLEFMKYWKNLNNSIEKSQNRDIVEKFNDMCLDSTKLLELFTIQNFNYSANSLIVAEIILTQLTNNGCNFCQNITNNVSSIIEPKYRTWFCSFIAVTLIVIASNSCALLLPLRKNKYHKKLQLFLASLAIGALFSASVFHLIPQTFGISEDLRYTSHHSYLARAIVIFIGLYVFFLIEQIMRIITDYKKHISKFENSLELKVLNKIDLNKDTEDEHNNKSLFEKKQDKTIQTRFQNVIINPYSKNETIIASIMWLFIAGESLHCIIDGLTIGAAFTETLFKGINLSVAVLFQELPHKLAYFSILIGSGICPKQALLRNCVSSLFIYLGLTSGILIGLCFHANHWIYAISSGMFLYIAVCDLFPSVIEMGIEIEKEELSSDDKFSLLTKLEIFLIENIGILIGVTIMFILAAISNYIKI